MQTYMRSLLLPVLLLVLLASGCPPQDPPATADSLMPAGAVKAEIKPGLGRNHSDPDSEYLWLQGYKLDGKLDIEMVAAKISDKAGALGYYMDAYNTSNTFYKGLAIQKKYVLRGWYHRDNPKKRFEMIYYRDMAGHWSPEYADFAIGMLPER